jgi:hypothetical protein
MLIQLIKQRLFTIFELEKNLERHVMQPPNEIAAHPRDGPLSPLIILKVTSTGIQPPPFASSGYKV